MTPRPHRRTRRASAWERLGRGLEQWLGSPAPPPVAGSRPWSPGVRIFDKRREVVIQFTSREIDPRRIRIQLVGNTLTLSGATHDLHPDHHGYHAFTRKIILPSTVNGEQISARARGPMLIVRLPKHRETSGESDLRRLGSRATVGDIMSHDVLSVAPQMPVSEAAGLLESFDIGSVPVCRGGKVLGILTDRDIAIRVTAKALDPTQTRVLDVMTPNPVTCAAEDTLVDAEQIMADAQVRRLPVVDRAGNLVGYLAMAKIARNEHDLRTGHLLRGVSEPG